MTHDAVEQQVLDILNKPTDLSFQPLPSEIFEQLNYNIEEDDTDKVYSFIKEEISSRSFDEMQELNDKDCTSIIFHLEMINISNKDIGVSHVAIRRIEKLIEKVELIRETNPGTA